jgi:hypothetical protein
MPAVPPTTLSTPTGVGDAENRLAHIKELRDKGLISQEEFDAKRRALLDSL